MKHLFFSFLILLTISCQNNVDMVNGSSDKITYVGRALAQDGIVSMWAAGGYCTFGFKGKSCCIDICDENLYGEKYNILEICVDGLPTEQIVTDKIFNRIVIGENTDSTITRDQLHNVFFIAKNISDEEHHVTICRNTETAMGFTYISKIIATEIFKWAPITRRRIEFIGNSITCGAEADTSRVSSANYKWGDWHRAYYGYGPRTARNLNAQWSLVSVSGIGLIHSCCDMDITMPQVYDKIVLRDNKINYDFSFNPDIVCSCLGQNDGIQDSLAFCSAYVNFIKDVRKHNPNAKIVILSSPMDHGELNDWLCKMIIAVVNQLNADGVENISYFFFSKAWNNGGVTHPNVEEHKEIADELTEYLKTII